MKDMAGKQFEEGQSVLYLYTTCNFSRITPIKCIVEKVCEKSIIINGKGLKEFFNDATMRIKNPETRVVII